MTVCGYCDQEMLEVDGCTTDWDTIAYGLEPELDGVAVLRPERCRDCGARLGRSHHPRCCVAACSLCGGQAISCACLDDEAEEAMTQGAGSDLWPPTATHPSPYPRRHARGLKRTEES
jgi:hypothetical protein